MKPGKILALGTVLVMTTFTTTAWAEPSVPRGAYIMRPVVSGQDLAKHVRTSPVVCQRYEKAWGLSTPETLKRFMGIRLGKMPQTAMLNVYYFRPATGSWGYKLRRVKRGMPVFLRGDGTPVMMQICGNPIALPAKPLSPQDQAKVADFTPDESIEILRTDTPPPADPIAFPQEQRTVALEESGAPPLAESRGETTAVEEASQQEKGHKRGFWLSFSGILSGWGSFLTSGLEGRGGTSNLSTLGSAKPRTPAPGSMSVGSVVRRPKVAAPHTLVTYVEGPLVRGSCDGGHAIPLSAPEPSLALMVPLLPIVLWKARRRNAVK